MKLEQYSDLINELNPLEQRLKFNASHWLNYDFNNKEVKKHISFISNKYESGISRREIIECFSNEETPLIRGFLMTMIWGHGASEHGRADNRGPWKVSEMLSDYDQAVGIIEKAKFHLLDSNLIDSHFAFKNMKRCRVNFFSKYLYFLGRAINLDKYPLIFDLRVANTIGEILSEDFQIGAALKIEPSQDAKSYQIYVNELHRIAEEINTEAEKIEYFLFKGLDGISLKKNSGKYTSENEIHDKINRIENGLKLKTPDKLLNKIFTVENIKSDKIIIKTESGIEVKISILAFNKAFELLKKRKHFKENPALLSSSNDGSTSGELDKVTRQANGNVRCVTYIVPILDHLNIIKMSGERPNSCWLVK